MLKMESKMDTPESDKNLGQIHVKTSIGQLICAAMPNPTTLVQANKNRKRLGMKPYNDKLLKHVKLQDYLAKPKG